MVYAKIKNNSVIKYPFTLEDLQSENPYTNYEGIDILNVYPTTETGIQEGSVLVEVLDTQKPKFDNTADSLYKDIISSEIPELVDGVWKIVHTIVDKSESVVTSAILSRRDNTLISIENAKLTDSTLSASDIEKLDQYESELNQIESLEGFPYTFDWPLAPIPIKDMDKFGINL